MIIPTLLIHFLPSLLNFHKIRIMNQVGCAAFSTIAGAKTFYDTIGTGQRQQELRSITLKVGCIYLPPNLSDFHMVLEIIKMPEFFRVRIQMPVDSSC